MLLIKNIRHSQKKIINKWLRLQHAQKVSYIHISSATPLTTTRYIALLNEKIIAKKSTTLYVNGKKNIPASY